MFENAARVIQEEKSLYYLQVSKDVVVRASLAGRLKLDPSQRPSVGDWVQYKLVAPFDHATIEGILPRKTVIYRARVGAEGQPQVMAANIDTIFIASSMNEDLNFNRIERYLAISWDSGAQPILVLTKSDLCSNLEEVLLDVNISFPGVTVFAVTNSKPETYDQLKDFLSVGTTAAVLGSSGVGKSTLINYVIGREVLKTQTIRTDDDKGRHTTTSRSIHTSRYGGLIMDTPGMRELQLLDHSEGVSQQFQDIEELMLGCKFSDCKHQTEPQCAIKEALESGALSFERFSNYLKLQAELNFQRRKQDKALASEQKKKWKKITTENLNHIKRKHR